MSWLRLIGLSCSTTEEAEDEIRLQYTSDWGPGGHGIVNLFHGHTMDAGDSITLTYEAEFEHAALVTIFEEDTTNPDDFIGSVLITPLFEGTGERTVTIERGGLGTYYLTFEVTRYRPEGGLVTLRLLTLTCTDAKERVDEAVLIVNGREIWDHDMRTGDTHTLDLTTEFRTEALIDLWERDRFRSDLIDSHIVDRALLGRGPQDVTLSRDFWMSDATYRLRYQVE